MQTWKLIGVGLLIAILVRGCPDAAKQSTSLPEKQPLQVLSTQSKSSLSSKTPLPLLKLPNISSVSPLLPKDIQDSSSSSIARNRPTDSEKSQSPSSQISVPPPLAKEAPSRMAQQEPETNFDTSRDQANVPVDETVAPQNQRFSTPVPVDETVAPQNQRFSTPVVSPSSESASGRCNYPWELDSAGNQCGNRAASERPNLSTGSAVGSYSPPFRSYSIPTSSYDSTYVRGYVRRNGTYVRGYSRRNR